MLHWEMSKSSNVKVWAWIHLNRSRYKSQFTVISSIPTNNAIIYPASFIRMANDLTAIDLLLERNQWWCDDSIKGKPRKKKMENYLSV